MLSLGGSIASRSYLGLAVLLATIIIWGSSFSFIKMVVPVVEGYGCVWFRRLIAILCLAPYVVYRHLNSGVDRDLVSRRFNGWCGVYDWFITSRDWNGINICV